MARRQPIIATLGLMAACLGLCPPAQSMVVPVNSRWTFMGQPPDVVVPAGRFSEVRLPLYMTQITPAVYDTTVGTGYFVSSKGMWARRIMTGPIASFDRPVLSTCNDEVPGGYPSAGFIPFVIGVSPAVPPGVYSLYLQSGIGWLENGNSPLPPGGWSSHGAINVYVVDKDQPSAQDIEFSVVAGDSAYEISIDNPQLAATGNLLVSQVIPSGDPPTAWDLVNDTVNRHWSIRSADPWGRAIPAGTKFIVKVEGPFNGSDRIDLAAMGKPGDPGGTIRADGCMQINSSLTNNNPDARLLTTRIARVRSPTESSACQNGGFCNPVPRYDQSIQRWMICHSDNTPYAAGEYVFVKVFGEVPNTAVMDDALGSPFQGHGELAALCDTSSITGEPALDWTGLWPQSQCTRLGASPWSANDLVVTTAESLFSPGQAPAQFALGPYLEYDGSVPGWSTSWESVLVEPPSMIGVASRLTEPLRRTPVYSNDWEGNLRGYDGAASEGSVVNPSPYSPAAATDFAIWDFRALQPFKDVSGRNPDGTVYGAPTPVAGPNRFGAHFNGLNDAVYVAGLAPTLDSSLTACVWYRTNAADVPTSGDGSRLLTFQASTRHDLLQIAMTPGGKISLLGREGPSTAVRDTLSTADGRWHGIQVVRERGDSSTGFSVSVDGRALPPVLGGVSERPDAVTIAARSVSMFPGTFQDYFKGDLGYVHVFEGSASCAFPNGSLGVLRPTDTILSDPPWRDTVCGAYCTAQKQADKALCSMYLDCYRDNSCDPSQPCAQPDGVCGVNGKAGGMAPKTIADQVFNCIGGKQTVIYQIDAGNNVASGYSADQYYSGGTMRWDGSTIDTSEDRTQPPTDTFQLTSERYGNSTYTLPNLTPGAQYVVRLHFAELWWSASGKRKFNVVINGNTVLSNFDIYATAGKKYKALVRDFVATANSSGQIVIKFVTVTDNATIEAIQLLYGNSASAT
jgi:hypothetical protein